jgi:predicted DNA-binding transcriptional regulator AlpA
LKKKGYLPLKKRGICPLQKGVFTSFFGCLAIIPLSNQLKLTAMAEGYIRLKQLLPHIGMSKPLFYRLRPKLKIPYYKHEKNSRFVLYKLSEVQAIIDQWRRLGGEE